MEKDWKTIEQELGKEFPRDAIRHKIQSYTKRKENGEYPAGTKGIKVAFINARDVMNRLDEVVGADSWSDAYIVHPNNVVQCELTVLGIKKSDAGYPNGDNDAEPLKSAFSDAFKRAAVKFGVGRFLYELDPVFVAVDKYGHEGKSSIPLVESQQSNTRSMTNEMNTTKEADKQVVQPEDSSSGHPQGDVSERQLSWIRGLAEKAGRESICSKFCEEKVGKDAVLSNLNKKQASELIDLLKGK